MELLCPHCRKMVSVEDRLTGQTVNCPHCSGPFTVPLSASGPAPESSASLPQIHLATDAEPGAAAPSPPASGYRFRFAVRLQPAVVKWVTPVCFFLLFVLLFFPWVRLSIGNQTLISRTGFGVVFGTDISPQERRADVSLNELGLQLASVDKLPPDWLALLYAFLVLLGLLAVVGFLLLPQVAPAVIAKFPARATQLMPWGSFIVAGLTFLTTLFLLLQCLLPFPIENAVSSMAETDYQEAIRAAGAKPDAERLVLLSKAETRLYLVESFVERSCWFQAAVVLSLLAVLATLTDFWLARRKDRPPPRMQIEW